MNNLIRVVIADDHPIFRKGLLQVIGAEPKFRIVGEADDGEAALKVIETMQPDVAILDVDMPNKDGFEVARTIIERRLPVEVIFLTMHKDESLFNAALSLGVKGYVLKDSALADIVNSIKAVGAGENFISPTLSTFLIRRTSRPAGPVKSPTGLEALTAAERGVLKLLAEYKSSKQIADELCISVRTVDHHRAHIASKLDLKGNLSLLQFAIKHQSEL
jgi:DNA-binding NarL/FixJ family response regulator